MDYRWFFILRIPVAWVTIQAKSHYLLNDDIYALHLNLQHVGTIPVCVPLRYIRSTVVHSSIFTEPHLIHFFVFIKYPSHEAYLSRGLISWLIDHFPSNI